MRGKPSNTAPRSASSRIQARRSRQAGFSLIELAVVLVIIGLLIGGGIAALDVTAQQSRRSEQQRQMVEVREALYGFAMSEGRLPCPVDLDPDPPDPGYPPDGLEDPEDPDAGTDCSAEEGALPWRQLGVGRRDAWGNPLLYRVTQDFADGPQDNDGNASDSGSSFALSSSESDGEGNLTVEDGAGGTITDSTPAVVVSFGPQGDQVWTDGGFVCPGSGGADANGFSDDETENCNWINDNTDHTYVAADFRTPDAAAGRFDDMIIWLPTPILKTKMVDVGRLPRQ